MSSVSLDMSTSTLKASDKETQMIKSNTTSRIYNTGALAVMRPNTMERAEEVVRACLEGGVDIFEISLTAPIALDAIGHLKKIFNDTICVGAGTVLDSETARIAILKGAEFIYAPNFDQGVALLCNQYQVPYVPGCSTVSEAIEALRYGASFIKLFPVSDFFGPKIAKVIKTPLPFCPLLASGGITLDNLSTWLDFGVDVCGFGGLLTNGSLEEITHNASHITQTIKAHRNQQ